MLPHYDLVNEFVNEFENLVDDYTPAPGATCPGCGAYTEDVHGMLCPSCYELRGENIRRAVRLVKARRRSRIAAAR